MASSLYIFTVLIFVHVHNTRSGTQRRLFNCFEMRDCDKPFVVYIASPQITDGSDESWFCMGSIMSSNLVLTAAACLVKDTPLYVISGYRRYVHPSQWKNHECIRRWKKKVIKICQPTDYKYKDYDNNDNGFKYPHFWTYADIGIARIEGKFDFFDTSVRLHCDYTPKAININYQKWYVGKGDERNTYFRSFTFYSYGWGHRYEFNKSADYANYDEELLQWANLELETDEKKNIDKCGDSYYYKRLRKFAIFVHKKEQTYDPNSNASPRFRSSNETCRDDARESNEYSSYSDEDKGFPEDDTSDVDLHDLILNDNDTRRSGMFQQGLCQNDHGAPLTTFVGNQEMLVGVGSASVYNDKYRCIDPSIFTSTYDTALFLKCVQASEELDTENRRHNTDANTTEAQIFRRMCDKQTRREGLFIKKTIIDWENFTNSDEI